MFQAGMRLALVLLGLRQPTEVVRREVETESSVAVQSGPDHHGQDVRQQGGGVCGKFSACV